MLNLQCKITVLCAYAFILMLPQIAYANDAFIRNTIENFSLNGLSLKSSMQDVDDYITNHPTPLKCKVTEGRMADPADYIQHYPVKNWSCFNAGGEAKYRLKIEAVDQKISIIAFNASGKSDRFTRIQEGLETINKTLLDMGMKHNQDINANDVFLYRNDSITPNYLDVKFRLSTENSCKRFDKSDGKTVSNLSADIRKINGSYIIDLNISNGLAHTCGERYYNSKP
ncbi:MAG: hypothetical protein CMH27_08365 [Micavibrio sp.]|nr:hypothetical protein [Micavibrio sp.]